MIVDQIVDLHLQACSPRACKLGNIDAIFAIVLSGVGLGHTVIIGIMGPFYTKRYFENLMYLYFKRRLSTYEKRTIGILHTLHKKTWSLLPSSGIPGMSLNCCL